MSDDNTEFPTSIKEVFLILILMKPAVRVNMMMIRSELTITELSNDLFHLISDSPVCSCSLGRQVVFKGAQQPGGIL